MTAPLPSRRAARSARLAFVFGLAAWAGAFPAFAGEGEYAPDAASAADGASPATTPAEAPYAAAPKAEAANAAESPFDQKFATPELRAARREQVMAMDWSGRTVVWPVHGPIGNTPQLDMVAEAKAAIAKADKEGAARLVVDMDSPGGSVDECNQIALALANAKTPTVAFVAQNAISGGAMLSLGCARIVMASHAVMGDIQPMKYVLDGMQLKYEEMSEAEREKIETVLRTTLRSLAEKRGRPVEVANAMVSRHKELHRVVYADGAVEYLDRANFEQRRAAAAEGGREIAETKVISPEKELLTMTAAEALEYGMADEIVADRDAFLAGLGLPAAEAVVLPPAGADMNLAVDLSNLFGDLDLPGWARMILVVFLVMGIAGLLVEYNMPGFGVPGVCSIIGWVGFFSILMMHDRGSWLGIFLFVLGVALLVVEIALLPGFGVAGIAGALCLLLGLFIAYAPDLGELGLDWSTVPEGMSRSVFALLAGDFLIMLVLGGLGGALATWAFIAFGKFIPGAGALFMTATAEPTGPRVYAVGATPEDAAREDARRRALVGREGVSQTPLRPAGKVVLDDGGRLDVVSDGDLLDAGTRVRVVSVEDNRVMVARRAPPE